MNININKFISLNNADFSEFPRNDSTVLRPSQEKTVREYMSHGMTTPNEGHVHLLSSTSSHTVSYSELAQPKATHKNIFVPGNANNQKLGNEPKGQSG